MIADRPMTEPGNSASADQNQTGQNQAGFDLGVPPVAGGGYRVLARKYRPANFDDLIGQDAMVRTISNAFETGRIPQAWILTGVRGVGKTTTARILARALNYELPDGSVAGPTIKLPVLGRHCQAIMESRHLDVLEMDAASHTGVGDVRQITDGVNYAPASARYKVYIIDEVHMLSTAAFNAFLKTLEEPPAHAKFIFATTEIRKVPITVLSRCQRFDLRRVDADVLIANLSSIAEKEKVEAEPDALRMIARAAEGSVRDSLSLFDQAIAHAAGTVRADDVRQMLGLADRTRIIELFAALAGGDIEAAFREFRDQYDIGADPMVILSDLAEFVNFVTRVKVAPATAESGAYGETERLRAKDFAAKLSMRVLSRMWQMLLKGMAEAKDATRPALAAEMVLVRIAYAADLPTPDEAIRALDNGGAPAGGGNGAGPARGASQASPRMDTTMPPARASFAPPPGRSAPETSAMRQQAMPQSDPQAAPHLRLSSFPEIVALAAEKRDLAIKAALESDVRLVRLEDGRLEVALEPNAPRSLVNDLARKLEQWTGRRWTVIVSNAVAQPTLRAQAQAQQNELENAVQADPRVQDVMAKWPGAKIETVRRAPQAQADADLPEPPIEDED
jgi:DNA polymerase III subunit gamma/tau